MSALQLVHKIKQLQAQFVIDYGDMPNAVLLTPSDSNRILNDPLCSKYRTGINLRMEIDGMAVRVVLMDGEPMVVKV